MASVKPFRCIRPAGKLADRIAALPYDVYSRSEAKAEVGREPLSFLRIDRAESQFEDDCDMYADRIYQKAHDTLKDMIAEGLFVQEQEECFYIYELTMNGRTQTGIVACASVDDYVNQVIKKHENTREEKEKDRIRHVDICNAQTGPIFLAYRSRRDINQVILDTKKELPLYDFTAVDGVRHSVWRIYSRDAVHRVEEAFLSVNQIYIADGHHRAASAVKVGFMRRERKPDFEGTESFNSFLSVLFPDDQLLILDYNRVVKDLNGLNPDDFVKAVSGRFMVTPLENKKFKPALKGTFGMYLEHRWYRLDATPEIRSDDPVEGMDVSLLQNHLLGPILGILDPKSDKRIDFVGGIRGLEELEKRADSDMKVAFALNPTSIEELFAVSDAGLLMPPKSTWFEPKLRSGLFIHSLE